TLPAPGATTGPDRICPGIPFLLGLADPVDGSGISYQWQQSADSMAWTDVAENDTAAALWASQGADTWYRALVTCAGAGTATSDPLHVSTSPYNQCYCAGIAFTVQVEPICHVVFAGIDQASPGTVDGAPAVEDFTGLAPA